jgi:hypothetical protein
VTGAIPENQEAPEVPQIAFESFGVPIGVYVEDPELLPLLAGLAPAPARETDPASVDHRISVRKNSAGLYNVRFDRREGEETGPRDHTTWIAGDADLDMAIASLDVHVQSLIALHAPDHTMIRAGVVSHRGVGIMLPGGPLTGKSALVRALAAAGAVPYSEDWAAIDEDGRAHPYLRPQIAGVESDNHGGNAGDVDGLPPIPIAAIVLTTYLPNANWAPMTLSGAEAMLALMEQAEQGSERPDDTFQGITKLMQSGPVVLKSDRPDAARVVPMLLDDVERALSQAA